MTGRFRIERLPPGRYRLWAAREGYVRAEYGARSPGASGSEFELRDKQNRQNVDVRLVQHSVLTGRVVNLEQQPLSGINVLAVRQSFRNGGQEFVSGGSGVTTKAGEDVISGLA